MCVYVLQRVDSERLLAGSLLMREHLNVGIVSLRQLDGRTVEERAVIIREANDLMNRVEDVLADESKWPAEADAFLRRHGMQPCWESDAYGAAGEAVGGPRIWALIPILLTSGSVLFQDVRFQEKRRKKEPVAWF